MSAAGHDDLWSSPRLWSLRDMINFFLAEYMSVVRGIAMDIAVLGNALAKDPDQMIAPETKDSLQDHMKRVEVLCEKMGMRATLFRVKRIEHLFKHPVVPLKAVMAEFTVLGQAVDDDANLEAFFHYNMDNAMMINNLGLMWGPTLASFPSTKDEIFDAADCFALQKHTASVFHSMRIAESGLRALAHERQIALPRGKPLEWGQWQEILTEINNSVNGPGGIGKTAKAGPAKDAALEFYNGAHGQFLSFKDQFRNMVMHARVRYDVHHAGSALRQVADFMNGLSARVNEKTRRPIRWGL